MSDGGDCKKSNFSLPLVQQGGNAHLICDFLHHVHDRGHGHDHGHDYGHVFQIYSFYFSFHVCVHAHHVYDYDHDHLYETYVCDHVCDHDLFCLFLLLNCQIKDQGEKMASFLNHQILNVNVPLPYLLQIYYYHEYFPKMSLHEIYLLKCHKYTFFLQR